MQDIVIKEERIKLELIKLLICFMIANVLNLYSIVIYGTKWWELFTQFHWTLILSGFMYLLTLGGTGIKALIKYFKTGKQET